MSTATQTAQYVASATASGREGRAVTSDGRLDVTLAAPRELGGSGEGTNPEQLFAAGYAACFESALKTVARRRGAGADDVSIDSKVMLGPTDERTFTLAVELDVTLPQITGDEAAHLVRAAHEVCPYSNATRGNIDVALSVNGEPLS